MFPVDFDVGIEYTAKLKNHLYRAKYHGKTVIVKFTRTYNEDLDRFCHSKGFAPELFVCQKATPNFKIVVMEELEAASTLHEYFSSSNANKNNFIKKCKTILDTLHTGDYSMEISVQATS